MKCSGMPGFVRSLTVAILVPLLGFSGSLPAQTHSVSAAELRKAAVEATQARQNHLNAVNGFLSSDRAGKALATTGINPAQLKAAVSALDDQELARLAARSDKAQADFAAGRISDRDLLIILLGIAALILIIVAVR